MVDFKQQNHPQPLQQAEQSKAEEDKMHKKKRSLSLHAQYALYNTHPRAYLREVIYAR
jgi:hypothetical protein